MFDTIKIIGLVLTVIIAFRKVLCHKLTVVFLNPIVNLASSWLAGFDPMRDLVPS